MSDHLTDIIHPITGKKTRCVVLDDYFGKERYGYRFQGERQVYSEEELDALTPRIPLDREP